MQVRFVKAAGLGLVALAAAFAPVTVDPGAAVSGDVPVKLNGACAGASTCSSSYFDVCSSANGIDYQDMKCATGCNGSGAVWGPSGLPPV